MLITVSGVTASALSLSLLLLGCLSLGWLHSHQDLSMMNTNSCNVLKPLDFQWWWVDGLRVKRMKILFSKAIAN